MSTSTATPAPRNIVIVGGGIMGCSTLYSLISSTSPSSSSSSCSSHPLLPPDSSVTLIESARKLAPGASGKAGGFLAEDWHGDATASLASLSFRLHRELAMRHDGADKWGWREVETLSLEFDDSADGEEGLNKKKKSKKQAGRASSLAAAKGLDWINSDHITSCSRLGGSGTTAQVTPGHLVDFLVEESQRLAIEKRIQVSVRLGTTAKSLKMDQGTVKSLVVSSSSGSEDCLPITDVVLAAGPWTGTLVKTLFPPSYFSTSSSSAPSSSRLLSSASRITGSRAHSVIIKGSRPITNHCLFTEMHFSLPTSSHKGRGQKTSLSSAAAAAAPEVYARADGTVYVCGAGDDEPLPATAEEVTFDKKKTRDLIQQTAILSPHVFSIKEDDDNDDKSGPSEATSASQLPFQGTSGNDNDNGNNVARSPQGAHLLTEQACYLPLPSGNMLLGGDSNSGIYITAGASCWGITLGLGVGAVMADLILTGGKNELADISRLQG